MCAELVRRCAGAPHAGPLLRFLEDATRHYFEFMEKREGRRHFVMHDPLAIAAALDPTLIETTAVAVDVETSGALASGLTLADWRGVWRRKPNAEVATAGTCEALRRRIHCGDGATGAAGGPASAEQGVIAHGDVARGASSSIGGKGFSGGRK